MTDNGSCYKSRAFGRACKRLGLKHIRTGPYTPKTNGKCCGEAIGAAQTVKMYRPEAGWGGFITIDGGLGVIFFIGPH